MADLRGEQLKDSYQNVVTRGTGNKLENGNGVEFADLDDKASLSGGADADFSAMPWVDGSPIVEKGSGSYYKWIKYANGSMIYVMVREFSGLFVTNEDGALFRSATVDALSVTEDFVGSPLIMASSSTSSARANNIAPVSLDLPDLKARVWSSTSQQTDIFQKYLLIGEWY